MQTDNKLLRAKISIIISHPFYATLMIRKGFIPMNNIKTAATDGKAIYYNPAFFDSLSLEEIKGVIVHELLHITNLHHIRRDSRDPELWNKACDYAINPVVFDAGFSLPKKVLFEERFADMSAEAIYNILKNEGGNKNGGSEQGEDEQDQQGQGSGQGEQGEQGDGDEQGEYGSSIGEVWDAPATSEAELKEAEMMAKQELAEAIQTARMKGDLPAYIDRMVSESLQTRVSWKEQLAKFLDEVSKNDYSFTRANTRYLSSGIVMPSLHSVEPGNFVLVVDTSGSVDEELLNKFAGEMQEICSMTSTPIRVIYVDSKVNGEQEIDPTDTFTLKPIGGGGTDFKPAFDLLEEEGEMPKGLIYFTDMCCYSFPEEPAYPVLWAKYGSYKNDPPFGDVIEVEQ